MRPHTLTLMGLAHNHGSWAHKTNIHVPGVTIEKFHQGLCSHVLGAPTTGYGHFSMESWDDGILIVISQHSLQPSQQIFTVSPDKLCSNIQ